MSTRIRVTLNPGTALTEYLMLFATNKERSFELLRLAQSALVSASPPFTQAQIEPASSTTPIQNTSAVVKHNDSSAKMKRDEQQEANPYPASESGPISLGSALDQFLDFS